MVHTLLNKKKEKERELNVMHMRWMNTIIVYEVMLWFI